MHEEQRVDLRRSTCRGVSGGDNQERLRLKSRRYTRRVVWSGRWDLNPRQLAWEARTLPLSYARSLRSVAHFGRRCQRPCGQLVLWPPPAKMRLERAVTPMHLIRLVTDDLHSRQCIENYLYRNTRLVSRRPFLNNSVKHDVP